MTSILRGKFTKQWRLALATIYSYRAITTSTKKTKKFLEKSHSYTSISIPARSDHPGSFFQIDQSQLTKLLKDKDLRHLQEFGGVKEVASALETDVSAGISGDPDDVSRRQDAFGVYSHKKPPAKGISHFTFQALKDHVIDLVCAGLLLGFEILQYGVEEIWFEAIMTFFPVLLVITVSAVTNYRQNRKFEKLSRVSSNILINVIRMGRPQKVSIFEIVVGDIVCLEIDDQVPADGLFLQGRSLQVDESIITGDSDHVEVNSNQNPFLFSGTKVADGYARMLVTSVGMNTTWGEMMSSISRDNGEQTPSQAQLDKLTSSMGKVGLAVAFLVLVVPLVRYFTGNTRDKNGNPEFVVGQTTGNDIMKSVVGIIEAAVTIVVVAIPDGLPLAVTLTLAYSMKKMIADQAKVRKLSACETMGLATTICTLTMNQMKVTKFWAGQVSVAENTYSSVSKIVLNLIQDGVALNTTGSVYRPSLGSEYEFSGSPTC